LANIHIPGLLQLAEEASKIKYFEEDELNRLTKEFQEYYDRAKKKKNAGKYWLTFLFLRFTGARISEVLNIDDTKDIDFRNSRVKLITLKRKRSKKVYRTVPIPIEVINELLRYLAMYPDMRGRVFNLNQPNFYKKMQEIGKRAGISKGKVHPHALRHTWAIEVDKYACNVLKRNFPNVKTYCQDIYNVNPSDMENINILTAGFPCQAFSIAGYRRGFVDPRGNVFFRILDFIEVLNPEIIFLENVKNLRSHDRGRTYEVIYNSLISRGYYIKSAVLNTMEFGNLPQNRERIYIVCFRSRSLWEKFCFPNPVNLTVGFRDLLEPPELISDKYYYHPGHRYFQILNEHVHSFDTVYQLRRVYVRENQKGVCPTLTANMGGGGHNVPIIRDERGIRKLTPRECARLQGFPNDFQFPVSTTQAYKQIGNSVSIPVIKRIAEKIKETLLLHQNMNNSLQSQLSET